MASRGRKKTRAPRRWGREGKARKQERLGCIVESLHELYPEAKTALDWATPLELLVATVLSAQCTDVRVNKVTPALFKRCPRASDYAEIGQDELEELIRTTGFYHNKAKSIRALARDIVERHEGAVPGTMEELVKLSGVGRKTANVVLGNAFGVPAIAVDTHVTRLSGRLDLSGQREADKIERDLMELCPEQEWTFLSHALILHGRRVCKARKPGCGDCRIDNNCPFPDKTK